MKPIAWTDEMKKRAKEQSLDLFRFELNGNPAKRASISATRCLTLKQAEEFMSMFNRWLKEDKS